MDHPLKFIFQNCYSSIKIIVKCNENAKALGIIGKSSVIPTSEFPLRDEEDWLSRITTSGFSPLWIYLYFLLPIHYLIHCLESMLWNQSIYVRRFALQFLKDTGTVKNIAHLGPLLKDKNDWARETAANILGRIGNSSHISLLESRLKDKSDWIRNISVRSIEQIFNRSAPKLPIDDLLSKSQEKKVSFVWYNSPPLHILHISDIHYASENASSITHIFHEFLQDIKKWRAQQNGKKIQAICITGDIAQSGQKNQYKSINDKINVYRLL